MNEPCSTQGLLAKQSTKGSNENNLCDVISEVCLCETNTCAITPSSEPSALDHHHEKSCD